MATPLSPPLYQAALEAYDQASEALALLEPELLTSTRQQAMAFFREAGLPSRHVEDYKYTPLTPYLREGFLLEDSIEDLVFPRELVAAATIPGLDCHQVVLHNGQYFPQAGDSLPDCIRIRPLNQAWQEAAFHQYFGHQTAGSRDAFAALNTALFRTGLYLEIDAGSCPGKPLHLVHVFTGNGRLWQPRHLVVLQPQASLTLVESVVADAGPGRLLVNELSEMVVGPQARLGHCLVQAAKPGLLQLRHTLVSQARDSHYTNITCSLPGAALLRNNLNVDLAAPQTQSHLYGFYLGAGHQLLDNHTLVNHRHPQAISREVYKGVLLDTATGVFNGKVVVHPDAQQINAYQQNNNLLLSPKAVIYSKPQLEIYADDVRCSHGSTTGQLNPEALFYLRSRGLGEARARSLLVQAFAAEVTGTIPLPKLREHVNRLIQAHLPQRLEMAPS